MKKFMTLALGLAFLTGTVATAFAQGSQEPPKKEQKKKSKKNKKSKKSGEQAPPAA